MNTTLKSIIAVTNCAILSLALPACKTPNPSPAGDVQVPAYPVTGMETTAYTVLASEKQVPVFDLWASGIHEKKKPIPKAYLAQFGLQGETTVTIATEKPFSKATVRPMSESMSLRVDAAKRQITVKMKGPQTLQVILDEDAGHLLNLCAVAITPAPKPDSQTMYFAPGLHTMGFVNIVKDDTSIYLAPGAVVRGWFNAQKVKNLSIRGSGILINDLQKNGAFVDVNQFLIDGPTLINLMDTWSLVPTACEQVTIRNLRLLSRTRDGVDINGCKNLLLEKSFILSLDDCVCLKGTRHAKQWPNTDIVVKDLVLAGTGAGNVIDFGHESKSEGWRNLLFSDIRIILSHYYLEPSNYIGLYPTAPLSIHLIDDVPLQDVTFRNILIEGNKKSFNVDLRIFRNAHAYNAYKEPSGYAPKASITGVLFENIEFREGVDVPSTIKGFSESSSIRQVRFKNLIINGKKITDSRSGGFNVGPFADQPLFE
jgi:hypothetical protein